MLLLLLSYFKKLTNNIRERAYSFIHFDPDIPFEIGISATEESSQSIGTSVEIQEDETLSFSDHNITLYAHHKLAVKIIDCELKANHGRLQPESYNGTVASVLRDFQSTEYKPNLDFNGVDTIHVECGDRESERITSRASLNVIVHPVNDDPEIFTSPNKTFSVKEDAIYKFKLGVASVYILDIDVDSDADTNTNDKTLIAVDLEMVEGEVVMPHPSKMGGTRIAQNSPSQLRILGRLDRVNIALQYVIVQFPPDWFGVASLWIRCTDSLQYDVDLETVRSDFWIKDYVKFDVRSVNDAPRLFVDNGIGFLGIRQGDVIRFDQGAVQIFDVDSENDEMYTFTWILKEVDGMLPGSFRLDDSTSNTVNNHVNMNITETILEDGKQALILQSRCKYSELSDATKIRLLLDEGFYGEIRGGTLTFEVTDSFGDSGTEEIAFSVAKLSHQIKFINTKTNLTTLEDEPLVLFDVAKLTLPGKERFWNRQKNVFKIITRTHRGGLIRLNKFIEGIFIPNCTDPHTMAEAEVSFLGPIQVIQSALVNLAYVPPQDWDTFDVLTFSVYDEDDNFSDQFEIHIEIEAVNDPPTIEDPSIEKTITNDGSQIVTLRGLKIKDVDIRENQNLRVQLTLEPSTIGGLSDIKGEDNILRGQHQPDNSHYIIEGTLENVNDNLSHMTILINPNYVGEGALLIKAFDDEEASSQTNIWLSVDSISSIPQPILPEKNVSVLEDEPVRLIDLFRFNETDTSGKSFVEKVEMRVSMPKIKQSDLYIADFSSSVCDHEIVREEFFIWLGDEKSSRLRISDSPRQIEAELRNLRSVSSAHVARLKEDGTSISIRLLLLLEDSTTSQDKEVKVSLRDLRGEDCEVNASVTSMIDPLGDKVWSNIWRQNVFTAFVLQPINSAAMVYGEASMESFKAIGLDHHLNNVLNEMLLVPPPHFFGKMMVKMEIEPFGGGEIFNEEVCVNFIAVDDAPTIMLNWQEVHKDNTFMEMHEDSSLQLSGINIVDVDIAKKAHVSVMLQSDFGSLCYPKTSAVGEVSSTAAAIVQNLYCRSSGEVLSIDSDINEVNEIIKSITYHPLSNWWGLDQLRLEVLSETQQTSVSITIFVRAVNDVPIVSIPKATMYVEDGTKLEIKGIKIKDNDIDMTIQESRDNCEISPCYLTLVLETLHGITTLIDQTGIVSLMVSHKRIIRGTLDSINYVLEHGIIYEPDAFFSGKDQLEITVTDSDGEKSVIQRVMIIIKAKKHKPRIILPSNGSILHLNEDVVGIIGSDNCEPSEPLIISCESIQILADDNDTIKISLSWRHGKLRLPQLHLGHSFVITSNFTSTDDFTNDIEIMDTVKNVNEILSSIHLKADQNFNSHLSKEPVGSILVEVQSDEEDKIRATIDIAIVPIDDPPVIMIKKLEILNPDVASHDGVGLLRIGINPIVIEEDESIQFKEVIISIRDVDCDEEDFLELSIKSQFGYLHLPQNVFARQWVVGNRESSKQIVVRSTEQEINEVRFFKWLFSKQYCDK